MSQKLTYEYFSRTDKDIIDEIQKRCQIDEDIAQEIDSINIEVTDGRVYLNGTISSLEIKEHLLDLIENTPGVVEVIDDLIIEKF